MRRAAHLAACAAIAAAAGLPGAEGDVDDAPGTVTVGGFRLRPMGNLRFHEGRTELHPKAMAGIGYDSNVFAVERDETEDEFAELIAGAEGRYLGFERALITWDVELVGRTYDDVGSRDLLGGHAAARWERDATPEVDWSAEARYERVDDPLIDTGAQVERSRLDVDGAWTRTGLANRLELAAGYTMIEHHEGGRTFGAEERDSNEGRLWLTYGRRRAEHSELLAEATLAARAYEEEDPYQDFVAASFEAGWRGIVGTRVRIHALAGVAARVHDDDFAGDPAFDDETVVAPIGSLLVRWPYEAGSHLEFHGEHRLDDATSANAALVASGAARLRHRLRDRFALLAEAGLLHLRFSGSAAGAEDEERTTVRLGGGLEYFLRDGVGLRGTVTWDDSESETAQDYRRLIARLQLGIVY